MSGGVDSSVAAALLVQQGYEVIGMTMQLWDYSSRKSRHAGRCCASEDIEDARRVAHHLKIPFYAINFQKQFMEQVVRPFMQSYISGRTPSPCVQCNSGLKFHELVQVADRLRASHIATGHYARLARNGERYQIWKAKDRRKDQSYFLFDLNQNQLERAIFPLGDMEKSEVRELARQWNLPVADKPESQQLCFLQGEPQGQFIQKHIPNLAQSGAMLNSAGEQVGTHEGVHHFTIGQRRGLGVATGAPQYVVGIDADQKTVRIGSNEELMQSSMKVEGVNWSGIEPPENEIHGNVRIRYKHEESPAIIRMMDGENCVVRFEQQQRAITPGQAAVFYQGDLLMGGGWIQQAFR
jgi:tRNA-specific 2-thiouridylase